MYHASVIRKRIDEYLKVALPLLNELVKMLV